MRIFTITFSAALLAGLITTTAARADDCSDGKMGADCVTSQSTAYRAARDNYNNWGNATRGIFSSEGIELATSLLQLGAAAANLAGSIDSSSYSAPVRSTYGQGSGPVRTYRQSTITGGR